MDQPDALLAWTREHGIPDNIAQELAAFLLSIKPEECPIVEKPRRSLNIGLIAYECLPNLVFVRVPNERGRWILTDKCVALVDCPACGSIAGEPCNNDHWGKGVSVLRYSCTTHCDRRTAAIRLHGRGTSKPKLRINLNDLNEARADAS